MLQSIEAIIGLATGSDGYADSTAFFTEQLANPSLTSSHVLVARGVSRLLKGEVSAAKSDLEEVLQEDEEKDGKNEEALVANIVATGLAPSRKGEAEELFR